MGLCVEPARHEPGGVIPTPPRKTPAAFGGTIAIVHPATTTSSNAIERRLQGLGRHRLLERPVRLYFRYREQLLYLVVGGWNTLFGYAVWALFQYLWGDDLPYLVVILLSWPIAVVNAYLGYRYIVFRSDAPILKEFPRFSLVYLATLCVNLMLLPLALRLLPFNIYVIQALFTAVVVVAGYVSHKYFSFGHGRAGKAKGPGAKTPIE
jgi:putative flippase GtrA